MNVYLLNGPVAQESNQSLISFIFGFFIYFRSIVNKFGVLSPFLYK